MGYYTWGYKQLDRTEQLSPSVLVFRATAEMIRQEERGKAISQNATKLVLTSVLLGVFSLFASFFSI